MLRFASAKEGIRILSGCVELLKYLETDIGGSRVSVDSNGMGLWVGWDNNQGKRIGMPVLRSEMPEKVQTR